MSALCGCILKLHYALLRCTRCLPRCLPRRGASLLSARFRPPPLGVLSLPLVQWFGNPSNSSKGGATWTSSNWLTSVRRYARCARCGCALGLSDSFASHLAQRFHTNFAEHSSGCPAIGVMRVCNDDLVQAQRGFGTHSHRDAEIATYITRGSLTHQDSMGTSETIGRGSVQYMSAGSGISHSEHNLSATEPLRFVQMWFTPRRSGLKPRYGSYSSPDGPSVDAWRHLVGDEADAASQPAVRIACDANVYSAVLSPGAGLQFGLAPGRQAYVLSLEGGVRLGELDMEQHDAALVARGPHALQFTGGGEGSHVLLIEMAA